MMTYTREQREAKAGIEPYSRVGICCGKRCNARRPLADVPLYRVREHVYRCRACFRRATGYWPA